MAAGYGEELLGRVSGLVVACTRRVSRATRRLLRRAHRDGRQMRWRKHQTPPPSSSSSTAAAGTVVTAALCARGAAIDKGRVSSSSGEAAVALWSRRILMGERCQPLDFAGAIHYDSFGRRLARPPMPRSASSLSCRSFVRSPADGDADVSDSTADADVSDASSPAENDHDVVVVVA